MSSKNIEPEDEYSDSVDILTVIRKGKIVERVRAVIHYSSNVGYYIRTRKGVMLAVERDSDGVFSATLPTEDT